jgi:hypothetical protein
VRRTQQYEGKYRAFEAKNEANKYAVNGDHQPKEYQMTKSMEDIFYDVKQLVQGCGCPTKGSLGELAIVQEDGKSCIDGRPMYLAVLYVWDETFNDSAAAATWFKQAGADQVSVHHTLYDDCDDIRDGRGECGRTWHISFTITGEVGDKPHRPIACGNMTALMVEADEEREEI